MIEVSVIATPTFRGPRDYLPVYSSLLERIKELNQDTGSTCARLIEMAGRTCYDSYGRGRSSEEFHRHILEVGHGSVLEHAAVTFRIKGVSRGLTHELVRHRVGIAISQRSTRYVDEGQSDWALHPLLERMINEEDTGSPLGLGDDIRKLINLSKTLYSAVAERIQEQLVAMGVGATDARKQARGAARGLLGNALETELIWTANIRTLRHFIEMRASEAADGEIRLLANVILESMAIVCPEYFNDYSYWPCKDEIGFYVTTPYRKV